MVWVVVWCGGAGKSRKTIFNKMTGAVRRRQKKYILLPGWLTWPGCLAGGLTWLARHELLASSSGWNRRQLQSHPPPAAVIKQNKTAKTMPMTIDDYWTLCIICCCILSFCLVACPSHCKTPVSGHFSLWPSAIWPININVGVRLVFNNPPSEPLWWRKCYARQAPMDPMS